MRIGFYIPPEKQRVGGLDLAIFTLRDALAAFGGEVSIDPVTPAGFDVIHFHGLWQPRFLTLARDCQRFKVPFVVSPHGMLEPWAYRLYRIPKSQDRSFLNRSEGKRDLLP